MKISSPSEFNPVLVLNEPHPHPWDGARLEHLLVSADSPCCLELSEFGEPLAFRVSVV